MKNHGNIKRWAIQLLLVVGALLWLTLVAAAWMDGANAADAGTNKESDEYSFNWLDPEKKIYVLQNRRYGKAGRVLLSAMIGPGFSNPYRSSYNIDPRAAYYFSEDFGIEAFYTYTSNSSNSTIDALVQTYPNTWPVVREIRSQYGVLAHWVPWYAKINVFNKILYFDWYFSGGIGSMQTALDTRTISTSPSVFVDQNFTSFYLGTGHQYHVTKDFTVRLDFSGSFYKALTLGTTGDSAWYSNYNFGIGFGVRL